MVAKWLILAHLVPQCRLLQQLAGDDDEAEKNDTILFISRTRKVGTLENRLGALTTYIRWCQTRVFALPFFRAHGLQVCQIYRRREVASDEGFGLHRLSLGGAWSVGHPR